MTTDVHCLWLRTLSLTDKSFLRILRSNSCSYENQKDFSSCCLTAGADSGRQLSVLMEWSVSIRTALSEVLIANEVDA